MRRLTPAVALLVAAALPAPARAAAPTVTYVFDRLRPHAGALTVTVSVDTAGEYAFVAAAAAIYGRDGAYYGVDSVTFGGQTADPGPAVPGTSKDHTVDWAGTFSGGSWTNRVFVVVHGRVIGFSHSGADWRVRRWTGATRVVSVAGELNVVARGYGYGHFAGRVTAPGGARGSIALAHLPCVEGMGAGGAWLYGGTTDVTLGGIGPLGANTNAGSFANGRTSWLLEGEDQGWSDIPVRLLVIDT